MDEEQYRELKKISNYDLQYIQKSIWKFLAENLPNKQRTSCQNRALHKNFQLICQKLNDAGYTVKELIPIDHDWTPQLVKDVWWRRFQKKENGQRSTKKLKKLGEIDAIHDKLMRELGEKYGIEYHEFPFDPEKRKELEEMMRPTHPSDIDYPQNDFGEPVF